MKFNAYPHDMQLCHLSMESCEYFLLLMFLFKKLKVVFSTTSEIIK
jgi:hypothetical protein